MIITPLLYFTIWKGFFYEKGSGKPPKWLVTLFRAETISILAPFFESKNERGNMSAALSWTEKLKRYRKNKAEDYARTVLQEPPKVSLIKVVPFPGLILEQLLKEARIGGEVADAVRTMAIQEPPRNTYEMFNLITWASSHLIKEPAQIDRARSVAANFTSAETHHTYCPVCHTQR